MKLLLTIGIGVLALSPLARAGKTLEEHWETTRNFFDKKDYLEAAKTLETLLTEHPTHWEARPIAGWFYWEASKRVAGNQRTLVEHKAESIVLSGLDTNKSSWIYNREVGDFYRLRVGSTAKAYPYYLASVEHFESATRVQKAALLDRLARSAEELGRKGDAVTASCRALEFDDKDKMALNRIKNLAGNCQRKGINLKVEGVSEDEPKNPTSHEGSSH